MIDFHEEFKHGVPKELPAFKELDTSVDHAPKRPDVLNKEQKKLALANSLRYFPEEWHEELAAEFLQELEDYGHIYMYSCLLYTSPSPRDLSTSRMPSSA